MALERVEHDVGGESWCCREIFDREEQQEAGRVQALYLTPRTPRHGPKKKKKKKPWRDLFSSEVMDNREASLVRDFPFDFAQVLQAER